MELDPDIVLRPRFRRDLNMSRAIFMQTVKKHQQHKNYVISHVDDHVFIRIPKSRSHFWSPELHLEIQEDNSKQNGFLLKGLYGPKSTVWTMFMFFHFVVAGLFIASSIWLYTRFALKDALRAPIIIMILMVLIWVILYIAGRIGRKTGSDQMKELDLFLNTIVNDAAAQSSIDFENVETVVYD
jgi:hypothetical protein